MMPTQVKKLEKDINKLLQKILDKRKTTFRKERIEVEFLIALRKLVELDYKELEKATDKIIEICALAPRE